jgi:hypothetical protein
MEYSRYYGQDSEWIRYSLQLRDTSILDPRTKDLPLRPRVFDFSTVLAPMMPQYVSGWLKISWPFRYVVVGLGSTILLPSTPCVFETPGRHIMSNAPEMASLLVLDCHFLL